MRHRFQNYIVEHNLYGSEDLILVAVSGGVDSVVLCQLLHDNQNNFAIAHCNFGLRAAASDADEHFAKELARHYQVPFFSKKFDTTNFVAQHSVSIQMAARTLRYEWFQELLVAHQYDYLATAHHLNDSIETVLLNLTKGTGIAGLRGILPSSNNIIRPLLFATKEEILEYANDKNLVWREDASNESNKYQRNLIRNKVVPLLKSINPNLEHTFHETLDRLRATERVFQKYVEEIKEKIISTENDAVLIAIENIAKDENYAIILSSLLAPYQFTWANISDIIYAHNDGVKQFFSPTHRLLKYTHHLRIIPLTEMPEALEYWINKSDKEVNIGRNTLYINYVSQKDFSIEKNANKIYLDVSQIQFPLLVRPWQPSDRFQPSGMKGFKKISDYLIDEKVPLDEKARVQVLLSGETILWIVGRRASHFARISEDTEVVMEVESSVSSESEVESRK